MFWDKNFQPSQNIEALLDREDVELEHFLEDEDVLQECKTQKKSLINYFTRPDIIKRLVELITTEPSDELPLYTRFRYAYMACEILTLGIPSLDEKILADAETMKILYSYLENEPPLNTLLSSFVMKTFTMLFIKKAEQDWFLYQQTCLQLLEYLKSQNNFLDLICKHFLTPIVPDIIMQMIKKIEGGQLKRNIYDWLAEDKLVERLIGILGDAEEKDKHVHVSQFLCDLILQGRNMRQNENHDDFVEPVFEISNPILKRIESETTIQILLNVILEPNALGSSIVSGLTVVLTLIKPVVFVEEAESDRLKFIQEREKALHDEILITMIKTIAPRLSNINELMHNPPNENNVNTNSFGNVRLHVCRLFTALMQTRNEEITKSICETDFLPTLLKYFKVYCWNNFLHTEMEKCVQHIFYVPPVTNNFANVTKSCSTFENKNKNRNNGGSIATSSFYALFNNLDNTENDNDFPNSNKNGNANANTDGNDSATDAVEQMDQGESETPMINGIEADTEKETQAEEDAEATAEGDIVLSAKDSKPKRKDVKDAEAQTKNITTITTTTTTNLTKNNNETDIDQNTDDKAEKDNDNEKTNSSVTNSTADDKMNASAGEVQTPSYLKKYAIVDCKIVSRFLDCWEHNTKSQAEERGRRLGYMGHLIKIFKHIKSCISEYEHIGAFIENNLNDAVELSLWRKIINRDDGDLTKILAIQNSQLANYNAYDGNEVFPSELPKDFLVENSTWDFIMQSNMMNQFQTFNESTNDSSLQFGRIADEDNDDDDDENTNNSNDCLSLFRNKTATFSNPWENPFGSIGQSGNTANATDNASGWPNDFDNASMDNFADFDAHFCRFTSALDTSLTAAVQERKIDNDAAAAVQTATTSAVVASTTPTKLGNARILDFDFASGSVFGNFDAKNGTKTTTTNTTTTKTTTEYDSNANVEKSLAPGAKIRNKGVIGDHLQSNNSQSHADTEDIVMGNDNMDTTTITTGGAGVGVLGTAAGFAVPNTFGHNAAHTDDSDDDDTIVNFLKEDLQGFDDDDYDVDDDEGMWTRPFGSFNDTDTTATTNCFTNGPITAFKPQQHGENVEQKDEKNDVTENEQISSSSRDIAKASPRITTESQAVELLVKDPLPIKAVGKKKARKEKPKEKFLYVITTTDIPKLRQKLVCLSKLKLKEQEERRGRPLPKAEVKNKDLIEFKWLTEEEAENYMSRYK